MNRQSSSILLLTGRPINEPASGRKAVLDTTTRALTDLGFDVTKVHIFHNSAGYGENSIARPSRMATITGAATNLCSHRLSLNELLYWSEKGARRVASIAEKIHPSFILCDMLRTYPLTRYVNAPVGVDFDDLLSKRYAKMIRERQQLSGVLGFVESETAALTKFVPTPLFRLLLKYEAAIIRKREIKIGRVAAACSLVSGIEAAEFSAAIGRLVHTLPMSIDPNPSSTWAGIRHRGPVFLGKMSYLPNQQSVAYFQTNIGPRLKNASLPHQLTVIGSTTGYDTSTVEGEFVRFLGFCDDINATISTHDYFIAPIPRGGGIKTKVVDAMNVAIPVVGSASCFEGLAITDRIECFRAETGDEYVSAIAYLYNNPKLAEAAGRAAQTYIQREFSFSVVKNRWKGFVSEVLR